MMQSAKTSTNNVEREAWENFEVGSFDDVIELSRRNPNNHLLGHLAILAEYESNPSSKQIILNKQLSGLSVFSPLVASYHNYYSGRAKTALEKFKEYVKIKNAPICLTVVRFGVKTAFDAEAYEDCLAIMNLDSKNINASYFVRERIECYFQLKKHHELIEFFRSVYKLTGEDYDLFFKAGLSLNALGKYKEAQAIFARIPKKNNIPTFEEKKKEFMPIISKISEMEAKPKLDHDEMKDLGFGYLFSGQYKKAEEVFRKLSISLAEL